MIRKIQKTKEIATLSGDAMARADLILSLVETGMNGDHSRFKMTAEAIAEDASSKHHYNFAERMRQLLTEVERHTPNQKSKHAPSPSDVQNAFYELRTERVFDDLVLPENVLEQCAEFVEEHARKDILRSYNLEPRHKIILSGPPGNGKTSLAEAIAHHLMLPFYVVRYEGLINRYLGESAQNLDSMFEFVKQKRCVLFFDEFDAISKTREDEHDSGEIKRVVNSLLKQIDMLPSHVVVIGATNFASALDNAIWRRFQLSLDIPSPCKSDLQTWLDKFSEKSKIPLAQSDAAIQLEGLSFAEFEEFALDVKRKYVLGLPDSELNFPEIVAKKIAYWKERIKR